MPTDVTQELKDRYGENFLIQITNDDTSAVAINTTRLTKAINDAQSRLYRNTGRKFEYTGISAELLLWQIDQVCTLVMWILEAYQAGQTLEADSRFKAWKEEVSLERQQNEVLEPLSNTPYTGVDEKATDPERYPSFQDSNFDKFIPDNDSGTTRNPW